MCCQILCLTTHDPEKRDFIISTIWKQMYTDNQREGFGAAWFSPNGEIGYYKSKTPVLPNGKIPSFVKKSFSEANIVPSDGGFLIIHGRIATCQVNVENTHPMLEYDRQEKVIAAMVHNGVVHSQKYDHLNTTCDSELLLQAYRAGGVDEVREHITGYYAFMMLDMTDPIEAVAAIPASEGVEAVEAVEAVPAQKRLHVCRDDRAPLVCGIYRHGTKEGYVIATKPDLIHKIKGDYLGEVNDNRLMVFKDAIEFDEYELTVKKTVYSAKQESDAAKAFGTNVKHTYPNTEGEHETLDEVLARMEREGESYAG